MIDSGSRLAVLRTLFDQPRWLEARFLYDERGSELFEAISRLPEYYLTRTEDRILECEAEHILAAAPVDYLVELGAGFSTKTVHLLREQVRRRGGGLYVPIDVSFTALEASRSGVLHRFPELGFAGIQSTYESGLAALDREVPKLFIFLGSSIGNLTRVEFLRFFETLNEVMGAKDFLLLGVDRPKDPALIEQAYNDSSGVTAEFILNALRNINRIIGSDFQVENFAYRCVYDAVWQQVEMYVEARLPHSVNIPDSDQVCRWDRGDSMVIEISRKFDPFRLASQLQFFGLELVRHFRDPNDWFSLLLLGRAAAGSFS